MEEYKGSLSFNYSSATSGGGYIQGAIDWYATPNIEGNYTELLLKIFVRKRPSSLTTSTTGTWSFTYGISGNTKSYTNYTSVLTSWVYLGSRTIKVEHENDGTASVTIKGSVYGPSGTSYSGKTSSGSQTITLETIPRASSVSLSTSSVEVGDTISATITRASSSFTHTVEFYINDSYKKTYKDVGTSQSFKVPIVGTSDWLSAMPNSTSCTAYCKVTTYNGSTQIGDAVVQSFTVKVPSGITPRIVRMNSRPTPAITLTTGDGVGMLVQNKNKLEINLEGEPGSGSKIKSYTLSGPSLSKAVTTSDSSYSCTTGIITTAGKLTYEITITDTRGRYSKETIETYAYEYFLPSLSSFKAYRANNDGTANVDGAYLMCTYKQKYADVGGTNGSVVTICYGTGNSIIEKQVEGGTSVLIDLNGDVASTYKVYATITDYYNGSANTKTVTVHGQSRIVNITKDGTGVAFGMMAKNNQLLESRWPVKVNNKISFGTDVQGELYTEQNDSHPCITYLMTGIDTTGGEEAGLAIHDTSVYVPHAENSGIINLGSSGRMWNQLYATNETISTSDRTKKKDIDKMSDIQEKLFDQLKPVTYKMISGSSNRTHYGFISQDVEEALVALGLTGQDFAGFCKDARVDDKDNLILDANENAIYDYALRYSEFIALNTYMIQKLKYEKLELETKVDVLEAEIQELKQSILELTTNSNKTE